MASRREGPQIPLWRRTAPALEELVDARRLQEPGRAAVSFRCWLLSIVGILLSFRRQPFAIAARAAVRVPGRAVRFRGPSDGPTTCHTRDHFPTAGTPLPCRRDFFARPCNRLMRCWTAVRQPRVAERANWQASPPSLQWMTLKRATPAGQSKVTRIGNRVDRVAGLGRGARQ